ncbi:MAG: c-type cytochrome domain-containing protein [Candidatus Hydrogenedentota bacterium]
MTSNRPVFSHPLFSAIIVCGISIAYPSARADDKVDFNRDVRPIISEKCYACHGPDSAAREKDLRFDIREGLFGKSEFGQPLIVPGDPEESEIYYRITAEDPDERMPSADSNLSLTKEEIDVIKRWIEEGAPWQGHWAFVPPERPELPAISEPAWPENEIDYFILQALDTAGMKPSAPACNETLIRRVSLDLTGLPPNPRPSRRLPCRQFSQRL